MINRLATLAICALATAALATTALATTALATTALADTRHLEATGGSLAIETPCARAVTIQVDPALSGKFILDATADHQEETARLVFDSAAAAKLHISTHDCDGSFLGSTGSPTLEITLRVPPATALAIDESGGARYTIGAVGKLALEISGGVQLAAESATGRRPQPERRRGPSRSGRPAAA